MAFVKKDAQTYRHIVLSFKDGFGFNFAKNKPCRIIVEFQKKVLSSQPIQLNSAPSFHCNFTWRIENNLLKRLYHSKEQIMIEFKVQEDDKNEYPLGCAIIALNSAKFATGRECERYLCLNLIGVKLPPHSYVRPQVWVLLTIQSNLRVRANEPCYSAEVNDEKANGTPKVPTTTKKQRAKKQISDEATSRIKSPLFPVPRNTESKQTVGKLKEIGKLKNDECKVQKYEDGSFGSTRLRKNSYQKKKPIKKPALTSASEKTKTSDAHHLYPTVHVRVQSSTGQISSDSSQKEKESSTELSKMESGALSSGEELFHIYKLEIHIANTDWTRLLDNIKVCVRFVNPGINNSVYIENKDLYVPNLELFDVICNMFYRSLPSQLYDTVIHSLPRIFIYEESNQRLIASVTIPLHNFILESQDEYFCTKAHLITKDKEVLGEMDILVRCTDMGVSQTVEATDLLKSVIEYKETINAPISSSQTVTHICREFQYLFRLLEMLKDSYEAMISRGDKADKYKSKTQELLNKSSKFEHSSTINGTMEEIRNYLNKPSKRDSIISDKIKPQVMGTAKEPSFGSESNKSETIAFCDFCQEYHRIKKMSGYITAIEHFKEFEEVNKEDELRTKKDIKSMTNPKSKQIVKPSFVIVIQQCQGCLKEVEIGYHRHFWKSYDDDVVLWCKDCSSKQQKHLKESTENIHLTDYIKSVENEYAKYQANTVSKQEYDRLQTAQHNLTMLFFHAKEQNLRLHAECNQISEDLEQLAERYQQQSFNQDETLQSIPPSVTAILQEIRDFKLRHEKQEKEWNAKQKELSRKVETQIREDPVSSTSLRRRERCEACQILHKTKITSTKKTKFGQSSSSYTSKYSKNKLMSSITSPQTVLKNGSKFESDSSAAVSVLERMCVHDIRDKLDDMHSKISRFLEERDKLVQTHHYTCDHPVILNITETVNTLFKEWTELNDELNKRL